MIDTLIRIQELTMKRMLCLFSGLFFSLASYAGAMQSGIDSVIAKVDPNINMGMEVIDLNTGETLYSRSSEQPLIPASNMKLISDAAAYLALGPDYRFKTELSTNAPVLQAGVLQGSIYIRMPGDPSFTHEDLAHLFSTLNRWGVRRITGNVIVESSHNFVTPYAKGIMETDKKYAYGAPIAPLMLDSNRLSVTVNPASRIGSLAVVEPSNLSSMMNIDNQVKTVGSPKGCGVGVALTPQNQLAARGCIGVGQWALIQKLPITNPWRFAQGLIVGQLKHEGIMLDGQVVMGQIPSQTLLIASHESKPIAQIMADTMKPSDNLYADSLFLHAAHKIHGSPLNWAESEQVVKKFLTDQTGIDFSKAVMHDGSGLSRQDALTVHQTVGLLKFLHNRFPIGYEYVSALPIAGRDGTLQKRFRDPTQRGMIRAKTGTMTGILGLSGYLYTQNGHTLAFAMFINKRPKTPPSISGRYRSLLDMLCGYMLKQTPGGNSLDKVATTRSAAFEQKPTQIDRQKSSVAKWRRIESTLKKSLAGSSVQVIFRGNQLVLRDDSSSPDKVWSALRNVHRQIPFAVVLRGTSAPARASGDPTLLWVKALTVLEKSKRTWTINNVSG